MIFLYHVGAVNGSKETKIYIFANLFASFENLSLAIGMMLRA